MYPNDEKRSVVTHLIGVHKSDISNETEILENNCSLASSNLTNQLRRVQYIDGANPFCMSWNRH